MKTKLIVMPNKKKNKIEELLCNSPKGSTTPFIYDMVVFSHIPWGYVYQRQQHLISRVSKKYKTLFIEAPVTPGKFNGLGFEIKIVSRNLNVLKPKVNSISEIYDILERLKIDFVKLAWFNSPSFIDLLNDFSAESIIYDCFDKQLLSKSVASDIKQKEKELLNKADLVLTEGSSLYEAKSKFSSNVYCLPSSIDYDHFQQAQNEIAIPSDIRSIKKPIIGYIGGIDERIDMELLRESSKSMPDYNFVMIGPWTKLNDEDLVRKNNIHYLGMKSYEVLPNYLKAFDIAMLPFVLNNTTRYMNPTKILEYMAAGKPIISTPIVDIVRQYGECVRIVNSVEEFKNAIEKILSIKQIKNKASYKNILERTSWDKTASEMIDLIKLIA